MVAFMAVHLYLSRRGLRWPRALALLPLSVAAIWLLNVVRVTALIAVGTWGSPAVALGGFHSKAGWVFFTLAALGLLALTQRSVLFRCSEDGGATTGGDTQDSGEAPGGNGEGPSRRSADSPDHTADPGGSSAPRQNLTAAYLAPLLAVLAVALLTGLATSGLDTLYPLRVLAAVIALGVYRRDLPRLGLPHPWLGLAVGLAVALVWVLGFREHDPGAGRALADGLRALPPGWRASWIVARLIGSIVTVPIVEELAFRGFLMRRFISRDFERVPIGKLHWVALTGSSVAFGIVHSQWALGIVAGFAYGLVTVARGRLSDAVLAHAVTNAILAGYVFATGEWALLV
jgi:CAAX prenyl protease-like protein